MSLDEKVKNDKKQQVHNILKLMSTTIHYISHPSITKSLECNLNCKSLFQLFKNLNINSFLNIKFEQKNDILIFKDTEALKVLYVLIVIINESDHPLYPCYLEWIKENAWMEESMKLFTLIKY